MPAWYFIDGIQIPPQVSERGIPCALRTLHNLRGMTFPASQRDDVLEILGWNRNAVHALPTSQWDTFRLVPDAELGERKPSAVYLECSGRRSAAWHEYLGEVAEWVRDQALPYETVIHFNGRTNHTPNADGRIHLYFGGTANFTEQERVHERDVHYQCGNLWVGELGPEHQSSRDLIPKILYPLLPRIIMQRYREPIVEIVPHEAATETRSLLVEWAQRVCRDVVLDVPHGSHVEPVDDGCLHLHVYSRQHPVRSADQRRLRHCFGVQTPEGCGDGLQPSPGADVLSDSNAVPIMEMGGSAGLNLYILCDLTHTWGRAQEGILRSCLNAWLDQHLSSVEQVRYVARMEHLRELGRALFVREGVAAHEQKMRDVAQTLEHARGAVQEAQRALIKAIREEETTERSFREIEALEGEERARLQQVFDDLLRNPYVRFVQYHAGIITIYTTRIYIHLTKGMKPSDNGLYDIGDFRIDLDTRGVGVERFVRVTNLTRKGKNGYHHPHVSDSGHPCLGTIKESLPRHVARRNYVLAFDLLLQLLHNVQFDDTWGRTIVDWPKIQ